MTLHPQFIEQIERLLPNDGRSLLSAITGTEPVTSIRLNAAKCGSLHPAAGEQVPWCDLGFYLPGHEPFTFDPLMHAGLYYVQDASSMILCHIIGQLVAEPVLYLDLCAAPGGKSTAAMASLPAGSMTVCNEVVPQRASVLRENVAKWGNPHCIVASSDSSEWGRLTHLFDVIAADVPCSGEGMFRKDAAAIEQWSPQLVEQCAARQRLIIDNVWPALRPGGLLIYSTCTYNRAENEDIVQYIENRYGATRMAVEMPQQWGVTQIEPNCYRFLPHCTRGEGLTVSILRKPDDEAINRPSIKMKNATKIATEVKQWLNGDQWSFTTDAASSIWAIDSQWAQEAALIASKAKVLASGIEIGSAKGKEVVPAQALALSSALRQGAFYSAEIDYATAISYLQGNAIALPIDTPRGITLLRYDGHPIGWAKQLGNRANNLYPRPWRIKSTHHPQQPPKILKQ